MDARFSELEFLSKIDREGSLETGPLSGLERDLVAFLALRGFVNDLSIPWQHHDHQLVSTGLPGESPLERLLHQQRVEVLSKVLGGKSVSLRITHAGRVRIAEIAQELRSARIREQFGILWDGRYFDPDLRIRLLDASDKLPVAVAYLDLNGLKPVNDSMGHNAGDVVIRAYLQAIAAGLRDQGDAYRLGGDEVGIILPAFSIAAAATILRQICLLLMSESLSLGESTIPRVSIAVGMVVAQNPAASADALRNKADKEMYRAKAFAKDKSPRPSSLAVEGEDEVQSIEIN